MWHVWKTEVHARFWWGDLTDRSHLEYLGLDERIKFKWIFRARAGSGWGQVAGDCECGNGHSDSIKCGKFHYYLRSVSFSGITLLHVVSKSVSQSVN